MSHTVQPRASRRRFHKGAKVRPVLVFLTAVVAIALTLSSTPRAARADVAAATAEAFINFPTGDGWSFDKVSDPPAPQSAYFTYSVYNPSWTAHAPSATTGADVRVGGIASKSYIYSGPGGFTGGLGYTVNVYAYGFISSAQSQEANSRASHLYRLDTNADGVIDENDEAYDTTASGGAPQVNGALGYTDSNSIFLTKNVDSAPITSFKVDITLVVRAFALGQAPLDNPGGPN